MASFSRKTGIVGALVIAGVLVVGAYILSGPSLSFFTPVANAESTQALLQAYAQKDSDNDGLPDWEEALYGTDPHNAHSISPEYTDGQEVAMGLIKPKFSSGSDTASSTDTASDLPGISATSGSLTDQFAQQFFGEYLNQQAANTAGTQPTEADIDNYAETAMQAFVNSQAQQDPYALSQVKVSGVGADALKTYLNAEAVIFANNAVNSQKNEIDYFSDAVEKNDASALTELASIGKAYSTIAPQLMQMNVPAEEQYAHLELANSTARLGADITDMSTMQTDPLRAYIGLNQYETDVISFGKAFKDEHAVFTEAQVTPSPDEAGYSFYQATDLSSQSSTAQ